MMTDKEFATIRTQTRNRTQAMKNARHWATHERTKYFDDKTCRKYTRDAVKTARKAHAKLLAAKIAGSKRPVGIVLAAVLPLMETFATHAAERTLDVIAKIRAKVQAEGLDVAYPEPARLSTQEQWNRDKVFARDRAIAARSFAVKVCGLAQSVTAEQASDEAVEDAVYNARFNFLSYAWKLDTKAGEVTAAKLTVIAGVWGESYLDVTKPDGSVVRWKTQTITNYSVYGTPYLQWPTRVVKM
jgi:hypothetical protein